MPRRTKILATLGPASAKPEVLDAMIAAGLDAVRLNFSHGTHEAHAASYRLVREAAARARKPVAILLDLQGPKIRLGPVRGKVAVPTGSRLIITARRIEGGPGIVPSEYEGLPRDVEAGHVILLDEGRLTVRVREVRGDDIDCDVLDGGVLSSKKGINVPSAALSAAALTDKDRADVAFGLSLGVDYVALSFVRRASDVDDLRAAMREHGRVVPIIAKIEKPQALEVLDAIVETADGLMVARGDLGVEVPLETVPIHQKRMITAANRRSKLVIVATQMLESMISNPAPTRAEASDVANAVLDGADAVMLSGETSVGEYPVHTVETMARIIAATEQHALNDESRTIAEIDWDPHTKGGVIAKAAAEVAERVGATYVVAFTQSGDSAKRMSRLRGPIPVLAFTPVAQVRSQLALSWGVETFLTATVEHTDEMVRQVDEQLLRIGRVREGDLVVIIAGAPPGIPGSTNALRIHRMGDAINRVAPAYQRPPR